MCSGRVIKRILQDANLLSFFYRSIRSNEIYFGGCYLKRFVGGPFLVWPHRVILSSQKLCNFGLKYTRNIVCLNIFPNVMAGKSMMAKMITHQLVPW